MTIGTMWNGGVSSIAMTIGEASSRLAETQIEPEYADGKLLFSPEEQEHMNPRMVEAYIKCGRAVYNEHGFLVVTVI